MPGMAETMHEFKAGRLHSGSRRGPVVTNRQQAIAIGLAQGRRAGARGGAASRSPQRRARLAQLKG